MRRFDNIEYEDRKLPRVKRKKGKKIRLSLKASLDRLGEEVETDDTKISQETSM